MRPYQAWKTIAAGVLAVALLQGVGLGQWSSSARETAETGEGGVLKKVWVKVGSAEVYRTEAGEERIAHLKQHAKAYHFGEAGDGYIAVGDKPRKVDCSHFGYVRKKDVIVWDTDQALRFVGADRDRTVELFADPGLAEKVGDAYVEGDNDPTVEPFPIFRKTDDGTAYEIAFLYRAAGEDDDDPATAAAMRQVVTRNINKVDVVFVMDITGSMQDELSAATASAGFLIEEFAGRTVSLPDGREEPMLFRFGFIGFRDQAEDGAQWQERIDFHGVTDIPDFNARLAQMVARGGGDVPESVYAAVRDAAEMDWNRESGKAIILIGDAPPKDGGLRDAALSACTSRFVRVHSIVIGDRDDTYQAFSTLSLGTGGQVFRIADSEDTETVSKIVDSLSIERAKVDGADRTLSGWAQGTKLSRDVQEFVFRGILPDFAGKPIPPTVFVSSRQDGAREVCLYKSKASLYEMLGDMQTDFVGMIEDPSPELLTAIAAGGVEFIAELDTEVLKSILDMEDPAAATAEVKAMLEAMPELPGMIRELNDKGALADWHALAKRTVALSRFVSDPRNFYEDHAWVPFSVLTI